MKTPLQERAESLAQDFKKSGRKPVVIEFSGSPKAGKTTTLSTVQSFLKRCGFKVEVVVERASLCPIRDKHHPNFNIWTACTTLAQLLEKTQHQQQAIPHPDAPEVLILDRGLFDSVVWLVRMHRLARIEKDDLEVLERFLLVADWRKRTTAVIVMTAQAEESLQREKGDLPVENVHGSIMNEAWLTGFRETVLETCKRLDKHFRVFQVDTSRRSGMDKSKTAHTVCGIVLDLIAEQLEESILCVPKRLITDIFQNTQCVQRTKAVEIVECFRQHGSYIPRMQAEESSINVQALPIVVVRNHSGLVLQLRRREKSATNPLHNSIVIWAGGHVRKEDARNGHSLVQGALRELNEELRLSLEPHDLEMLGAIYIADGEGTSKHVAVVFQWVAPTDDVETVLSGTEFFERRGGSLSGKFVEVSELAETISKSAGSIEQWSEIIVQRLLPKTAGTLQESLL